MCRLGKQLARGLLAKDVLFAIGARKLVSRVGLTESELYIVSHRSMLPRPGCVVSPASVPEGT